MSPLWGSEEGSLCAITSFYILFDDRLSTTNSPFFPTSNSALPTPNSALPTPNSALPPFLPEFPTSTKPWPVTDETVADFFSKRPTLLFRVARAIECRGHPPVP